MESVVTTFGSPDVFAIVTDVYNTTPDNGPIGSFHFVVGGKRVGRRDGDEFLRMIAKDLDAILRSAEKRQNDEFDVLPADEVFSRVWGERRPADFNKGEVGDAEFSADMALEPLRALSYNFFFDGVSTVLLDTARGEQRLIWKDDVDDTSVHEALIPIADFQQVVTSFTEWASRQPPRA
jgi:hypothetical protein